jgi:hypothetical protein
LGPRTRPVKWKRLSPEASGWLKPPTATARMHACPYLFRGCLGGGA